MDKNIDFIPYNAKLSEEELKALYANKSINGPFNIINLNDYNNILKSFDEKKEKEEYKLKKAQEREILRKKGLELTDRIKSKSMGNTSVHERMKDKERKKEKEREKVDEEWRKIMEKERKEVEEKIKERKFNARNDVFEFNKKIQESNMYHERQLQIEYKKKRKALKEKMDKEFEMSQIDHLKSELLLEKIQEHKKKLEEIEAGKQIKEQILKNKELREKMKEKEEEELLKSGSLIFDPVKTEDEKREDLRKLYEDIDKQIQYKKKLKKKELEEDKKIDLEIMEFNNNKSLIEEKIANVRKEDINKKIHMSELAGKNINNSERRKKIEKFFDIISKKDTLFSDKEDKRLQEEYKKHLEENTQFQLKQMEEVKRQREKEERELREFYFEKGVKAYNELKEEEAKRIEREKLMNEEQLRINKEIIEDKRRREEEKKNDNFYKLIDEENKKKDDEFNEYVLKCINELEAKGRDTRNLYSSLITEKEKVRKEDIDCLPDTFRRLGLNGMHNGEDEILKYLQKNEKNL